MTQDKQEEWAIEFDKQFESGLWDLGITTGGKTSILRPVLINRQDEKVKTFIHQLLAQQREEIVKEIRNETRETIENCSLDLVGGSGLAPFRKDYTDKWKLQKALDDVLAKLVVKKEK